MKLSTKLSDLSPESRALFAGKRSLVSNYDKQLFLNDDSIVQFTDFIRKGNTGYFVFDNGANLWQSQLYLPMFRIDNLRMSDEVEFCTIKWKDKKVDRISNVEPDKLFALVEGKRFRVSRKDGYFRPDNHSIEYIRQRLNEFSDEHEKSIDGLYKSCILYTFIEL